MHARIALSLILFLGLTLGLAAWWLGREDVTIGPNEAQSPQAAAGGAAVPAVGGADDSAAVAPMSAGVAEGGGVARVAATAPVGQPALVGRIIGPDGKALAGARIVAAGPLAFANANGEFDLGTFNPEDMEDVGNMGPAAMMRATRAQFADRVETTSDVEGRFRLVPVGKSRGVGLRCLAVGFRLLDKRVARPIDKDVDLGELRLDAAVTVRGRVVVVGGSPLADALVRAVPAGEAKMLGMMGGLDVDVPDFAAIEALRDGESARTDAEGRFTLSHVAPGDLLLRARHTDHPSTTRADLQAVAGQELRDVLITMPRGTSIRGRVLGIPSGVTGLEVACARKKQADGPAGMMGMFGADMLEALSDAGLGVGDRSTTIAADGSFALSGLAADTYRIWVSQSGEGFAGSSICSARAEVPGGSHSVELRYDPGLSVSLQVVDATTDRPIERLWVSDRVTGGGGMAEMMAMAANTAKERQYPDGRVVIANLRPKDKQKLNLQIDAVGYGKFEQNGIELKKGEPLDLGVVRLQPAPVVRVTVLDGASGRAVPGASVRLQEGAEASGNRFMRMAERMRGDGPTVGRTDREGRCVLNRPKGAQATVVVEATEFADYRSERIDFSVPGPIEHTANLRVGGTIVVRVVGPTGAPVAEAFVDHAVGTGGSDQRKVDAMGLLRIEHAAAGVHRFCLGQDKGPFGAMMPDFGDSEPRAWQEVTVVDGGEVSMQLEQAPAAHLRGVVRDGGVALVDAKVAFAAGAEDDEAAAAMRRVAEMMPTGGDRRSVKTDATGKYELAGLPAGSHRLRVTHKRLALPLEVPVTLRVGDNTFDVELPTTVLRGVVRDASGQVIEGARVTIERAEADESRSAQRAAMAAFLPGGNAQKTDASGAFELRGAPTGVPLRVSATAKGWAPAGREVTIDATAGETRCDLQLQAAGKIKVSVPGDAAMAMAIAKFVGDESVAPVMQMLRKGKVTLDGLRAGTWEVSCEGMGARGERDSEAGKRTVEVKAGETVNVDF